MTLEELTEIFNKAEATAQPRGLPATYTYYIPYGSGIVDAGNYEYLLEQLEGLVFEGYAPDGSPIFAMPSQPKAE